jgi:hypothetical protein
MDIQDHLADYRDMVLFLSGLAVCNKLTSGRE